MSHFRPENAPGWLERATLYFVVGITVFCCIIQTILASQYTIWGDEWSTIQFSLIPWHGDHDFWWKLRSIPPCPPGEPGLLRLFFKSQFFDWARRQSFDAFWRIPYIFMYGMGAVATYLGSLQWLKVRTNELKSAPLLPFLLFAAYLLSGATFFLATEVRNYIGMIFLMTLATWRALIFIERDYPLRDSIALSLILLVGMGFHIAFALPVYLFWSFGWFRVALHALAKFRRGERATPNDIAVIARWVLPPLIPYLFFKYMKHHWIILPGGKGIMSVLWHGLRIAPARITSDIANLMPFPTLWHFWAPLLLIGGLALCSLLDVWRKNWKRLAYDLLFLAMIPGGTLMLLLSTLANDYIAVGKNFIFIFPFVLAAFAYLFTYPWAAMLNRIPGFIQFAAMLLISIGLMLDFSAKAQLYSRENPLKAFNTDLGKFMQWYPSLPDRKQLVMVGVGDGALWMEDDQTDWLGGIHLFYSKDLHPLFLNIREKPTWKVPTDLAGWSRYDLLIFGNWETNHKLFPQIPWKSLRCDFTGIGNPHFCRVSTN